MRIGLIMNYSQIMYHHIGRSCGLYALRVSRKKKVVPNSIKDYLLATPIRWKISNEVIRLLIIRSLQIFAYAKTGTPVLFNVQNFVANIFVF